MFIFTLNKNNDPGPLKNKPGNRRLAHSPGRGAWLPGAPKSSAAVRNPAARTASLFSVPAGRMVQFLLLVVWIGIVAGACSPAAAVEFVTRQAFSVEKNAYKDYPFRVLFQKLSTSEGAEKIKIRNVIILKQVFEPEMQKRARDAGVKFEQFYGVVKSVDEENLRLWLPQSDTFKDFPMGIDRLPLENKQDYKATAESISKFAAIVHVLDNRVYKLTLSFALPAPEKLAVQRQGELNVVSWPLPRTVQKPTEYRVFVNGKPFKTVSGTSVEIPRSREQADEFFVKSVYLHHKGRIESEASPTLYDAASAKEIQLRQEAGALYATILAATVRADRNAASKLLDENQQLLNGYLNPERKMQMATLGSFFQSLNQGDRLTGQRPETPENLTGALAAYQAAAAAAEKLPPDFNLTPLYQEKIGENAVLATRLETRLQKQAAAGALAQISADLNPDNWTQARKRLYQQQDFLAQQLAPQERTAVLSLAAFFKHIDAGDLKAATQPLTSGHLEEALDSYRQAQEIGRGLPANLDAGFIAREKIQATVNRQASLADEKQKALAAQTWATLGVALNPTEWQTAQTMLADNRALLMANLDPASKAAMASLVDFFGSIDEGDRFAASQPATIENLEMAAMFYQRADQKAQTLPASLDVDFITRIKMNGIEKEKSSLQAKLLLQESEETYQKIVVALDTGDWRLARGLVIDQQALLVQRLDATRKADLLTLAAVFKALEAGDRLANSQPPTPQSLNSALNSYRKAVEKSQSLPASMDTGVLVRQKIRAVVERQDLMATGEQQDLARKSYDRIIAALTPVTWKTAQALLVENEALLSTHPDPALKTASNRLSTFFELIDEGDRLTTQKPETIDNLNMALSAYRLANKKLPDLAGIADLTFLTKLKIETCNAQRTALESKARQEQAGQVYAQVRASLKPAGWEPGMRLALEKLPPVLEDLNKQEQENARQLVAFFQDVEAGDKLAYMRPETDANLEKAQSNYRLAAKKAQSLEGRLEVLFIAQARMSSLNIQRAELVKRQQALLAAQQAPRTSVAAVPTPRVPAASALAAFDATVDKKTAAKRGMKNFGKQNYDLALKYFEKAYTQKIVKLKKSGKKQSFAVLQIPPKVRAEIIYLVQLDALKKSCGGDEELLRDGLMEIQNEVEGATGPWSIIKERKRNRILKHIEHYPF